MDQAEPHIPTMDWQLKHVEWCEPGDLADNRFDKPRSCHTCDACATNSPFFSKAKASFRPPQVALWPSGNHALYFELPNCRNMARLSMQDCACALERDRIRRWSSSETGSSWKSLKALKWIQMEELKILRFEGWKRELCFSKRQSIRSLDVSFRAYLSNRPGGGPWSLCTIKKSVCRFSYCSWFVFFSCSGDQHFSLWFFQRQGAELCLAFVSGMWSWWGCIDVFAVSCVCVSACLSTKDITYANMGGLLHLSFLDEVALSLVAPCSFCLCLFLNDIQKQLFQGFLLIQGPPVSRLCL